MQCIYTCIYTKMKLRDLMKVWPTYILILPPPWLNLRKLWIYDFQPLILWVYVWNTVPFCSIQISHITCTSYLYTMSHLSCVPRCLSETTHWKGVQIWQFRVYFFWTVHQRNLVTPILAGVWNQKFGQRGHRSHPCLNWMKWYSIPIFHLFVIWFQWHRLISARRFILLSAHHNGKW